MKNHQSGFTLIELIVVIVILGILAATALPKFGNLAGDARVAKMNGAIGAIAAGNALAHASQLAQGLAGGSSISMDGVTITMTSGYPDNGPSGIVSMAGLSSTDFPTSPSPPSATAALTIQPDAAHTGTTCTISIALQTGAAPPVITKNSLNNASCL